MNGLNETIKTKKMPENGETEAVINTAVSYTHLRAHETFRNLGCRPRGV